MENKTETGALIQTIVGMGAFAVGLLVLEANTIAHAIQHLYHIDNQFRAGQALIGNSISPNSEVSVAAAALSVTGLGNIVFGILRLKDANDG
ncbi:MAG: hypothetical protein ACXWLH_03570 [Candidatus Saccharimonadales bacterium]